MLPASSKRRRWWRNQSGATALEFAFVAPVFLFMLLGTMELARYYFIVEQLRTLTAQVSRAALISCTGSTTCPASTCPTSSSVLPDGNTLLIDAKIKTPFLTVTASNLTINCATSGGVTTLTVTANYPYTTMLPLLSHLNNNNMTDTTVLSY